MSDEKDSAPRTRPFAPPLPPFRGPAAARAPLTPLTPPESRRGALFIGTRAPAKTAPTEAEPVDVMTLAPDEHSSAVDLPPAPAAVEAPPPSVPDSGDSRAEAVAATEAMPWLFTDPRTADAKHTPPEPLAGIVNGHMPEGDVADPEEASHALSGLPYIDQSGEEHQPEVAPVLSRPSGRMHRVDFDVAGILERIAERVRAGEIDVGLVDPTAGDAAALATVLAALLRQRLP
jgi:hypothetical protein